MKKSDQKQFQDLLKQDTRPRSPKKTEADASDDLAKMFDDGTPLPSAKSTTGTGGTGGTGSHPPVAPVRDYMKVANSLHREAAPAGVFKGKGKLIYDYLYSRTRGAIAPTRTVQASWREIMKAASIGSDKTLREQLKFLRAAGLVTWEWAEGSQGGSVYTVYLPEEATGTGGTTGTGSTSGTSGQNLPPVPAVESTTGTGSANVDLKETSTAPKTSFKTSIERDDDEALAAFTSELKKAVKEITGKGPLPAESERWRELADVLVTELKIAAGRTSVSSVPSFFAEHLRRRLFKKDRAQLAGEEKAGPPASVGVDASKCQDCFGTGMWYPEGYEKGVAKCRHEKLLEKQ
jgi:hypothetical protein